MFVTYQTLRSAMNANSSKPPPGDNSEEETILVSPAPAKSAAGSLENRKHLVVSIPQCNSDEEHSALNASLNNSLRGSTPELHSMQQSASSLGKQSQPARGLPLTKNSIVTPEPKLLHP